MAARSYSASGSYTCSTEITSRKRRAVSNEAAYFSLWEEFMTLEEIRRAVAGAKDKLWAAAVALGRDPKIYLHWTAGAYDDDYPDYHFSIHADGSVIQTHDFNSAVAATYMRNSGSVSVALDCCADAVAYAGGGGGPWKLSTYIRADRMPRASHRRHRGGAGHSCGSTARHDPRRGCRQHGRPLSVRSIWPGTYL